MSNAKQFASHADLEQKKIGFDKLSDNTYAYTAEGDPNKGMERDAPNVAPLMPSRYTAD